LVTRRYTPLIELLIVNEANRLKDAELEQIRDLADRGRFGLVLLGMPGLDKRLTRAPQLYSRIGFVHQMEPLSEQETRFFWIRAGVIACPPIQTILLIKRLLLRFCASREEIFA
jgi:hypothetical protein